MLKTVQFLALLLIGLPLLVHSQSTLNWGTYIGGEFGASITDVAVSNGYVALVGSTSSAENIAFGDNIHQSYLNNVAGEPFMLQDAYVALYTLEGELQWCTYFGGEASDRAEAVVFDGDYIIVVGSTESTLDIATDGAFQESFGGGSSDGFIAKFNLQGELLWASYFGGSNDDGLLDIVQNVDRLFVSGSSSSSDFPILDGIQNNNNGERDASIAVFDYNGNLLRSSLFGGNQNESATAIVVMNETIYFGCTTSSLGLPTTNAFQQINMGISDAFISSWDLSTDSIQTTLLGGEGREDVFGIEIFNENVAVVGNTSSSDFPLSVTAFNFAYSGGDDGVFSSLSFDLSTLSYSTYLGASEYELFTNICTRESTINLIGGTTSAGLASPNAYQNEIYEEDVLNDFILYQFDLDGNYLHSTYLGGEGQDIGTAVWAISDTQVIFAGNSNSSGLSTNNAHQEQLYSGWMHGYLGLMDFGVGIDEETTTPSQLKIYPNPSAGQIRLQSKAFSEGERVTISVYNTHGQAVQHSTTAFNTNMGISLEELSSGVYEVLLTNGVSSVRQRLILQ